MKGIVRIVLLIVMVAVAVAAILRQRRLNDQFRRELAFIQRVAVERTRLRDENTRLAGIIERQNREEGAREIAADLERARQNLRALERREEQVVRTKAAGDIAANRDPEKGMVRLEHFRNMGRATPAAAVQTAIWAAASADFEEVGKTMMLSEAGRVKAQTLLDQQPTETRARFSSPEKLVGVLFAHDFTDEDGFQLVDTTANGAEKAVVRLRRLKHGVVQGGEREIPLRRSPNGWQMVVPDRAIDDIPDYLASASLRIGPPSQK